MKEWSSQTAFRRFYDLTYDRLFRIAYYYVKREEWAQEIVLDVFLKLWEQRNTLPYPCQKCIPQLPGEGDETGYSHEQ